MRDKGKEPICEQRESMPNMKRANLKGGIPKVKQVILWIMLTEPLNDFLSPRGTYKTYLWKMFKHQMHIKLLGSTFGVRMCYDFFNRKTEF